MLMKQAALGQALEVLEEQVLEVLVEQALEVLVEQALWEQHGVVLVDLPSASTNKILTYLTCCIELDTFIFSLLSLFCVSQQLVGEKSQL